MRLRISTASISNIKTLGEEDPDIQVPENNIYDYTIIDLTNGGRILVRNGSLIYVETDELYIER